MATRKKRAPPPVLTSLSSDWYWEQDAALRFRRIEVQTGAPEEHKLAQMNLGKRPWETGLAVEGGWPAHRALLEAHAPFREVQMWREFEDGSRRFISVSGEPVLDARGRFAGYRGVGRDVTEQKRGEQLLRLQHTVTRRLAEAADAALGIEAALRAVCETENWDLGQLWRLVPGEAAMRRFAHWARPEFPAAQRFADALADTQFASGEGLPGAAWASASPLWIADATQDPRARNQALAQETGLRAALFCPIVAADGGVSGILSFDCRRIRPPDQRLLDTLAALGTQLGLYLRRADSEARLRESEERFRRTFEMAGSGIAHVAMDGRFLRVNRRLCEILRREAHDLVGRSVKEVSHPEDRDVTDAQRRRLHAGEVETASFEKRYLRGDGSLVWTQLVVALERDAAGKPLYEITLVEDISARKAAEEALRASEERFRRTFELAGVGVALIGLDRRFQRVNRRFCEVLGYAEAELVGNTGRALSHPEDLDAMNAQRPRLYSGEADNVRGEKRYLRKDGSVVWVAYTLAIERDAAGKPLYEIAVYDDISARKAAEQALRESEARFRSLTHLSSDWFWEQDAEYRFTRIEGRNSGRKAEEVIGTRCWDGDLEVEGGWDAYRALLEARQPFHDLLMWRRLADGRMRYVRISGEPVLGAGGRFAGYRGIGRDVTEEKRAEQLLRLEHQVARALSTAEDAARGLTAVIRALCESEGWACGRFFAVDDAGERLRYELGWSAPGPFERFLRESRDQAFAPGQGLIGRVWQDGQPLWSTDTRADPRVAAQSFVVQGARGAFVFGVAAEGRTLGVLTFTSPEVREPDERLLEASGVIGTQVGQFVQRMRAEEDRRRFRLAMDSSGDMILLVDRASMRYVDVNRTACTLLGYSRAELLAMGPAELTGVERPLLERAYDALIAEPSSVGVMSGHYRCKDGSSFPFESTRRVLDPHGRPLIVAIARDMRERLATEEALRESEARFRALTEMSSDFFWETDAEHRLTDMVYGRGTLGHIDEAIGKAAWEVPYTHPDEPGWAALRAKVQARQPFRDFEFGRPRRDGSTRYFSVSGEPRHSADGRFLGYRGVGRDITESVVARERIASLAFQDALTGLANRTSLAPALEQAVERTRRRGSKLAGVFLDLDGFKEVNDAFGHDAGDRLLIEAAARLRAALRASDPVARLGGDEFFVVLEDLRDNRPAERVAQKLLEALAQPYDLGDGRSAQVSASIGISVYPDDAGDAATLMKHADAAMYAAKQAGKNAFRFYTAGPAANDARPAAEEEGIL